MTWLDRSLPVTRTLHRTTYRRHRWPILIKSPDPDDKKVTVSLSHSNPLQIEVNILDVLWNHILRKISVCVYTCTCVYTRVYTWRYVRVHVCVSVCETPKYSNGVVGDNEIILSVWDNPHWGKQRDTEEHNQKSVTIFLRWTLTH